MKFVGQGFQKLEPNRQTDRCDRTYYHLAFTGGHRQHAVVLTCCKSDSSSQWETSIFGPPQTENPLTDLDKICHQ